MEGLPDQDKMQVSMETTSIYFLYLLIHGHAVGVEPVPAGVEWEVVSS